MRVLRYSGSTARSSPKSSYFTIFVPTVCALFTGFGSGFVAPTLALLVIVTLALAVTRTVIAARAPVGVLAVKTFKEPTLQVTTPALKAQLVSLLGVVQLTNLRLLTEQLALPNAADTNDVPTGSVSVIATLVADAAPKLAMPTR